MRTAASSTIVLLVIAVCGGCSTIGRTFDALFASKPRTVYVQQNDDQIGPVAQANLEEEQKPKTFSDTLKSWTGNGPKRSVAQKHYQLADARFRKAAAAKEAGQPHTDLFVEAAEEFGRAASRWPNSALEQDGMFMVGESYFFADRYPKAVEAYGKLIKKYPNSRHLDKIDKRRFAIAQYWLELNPQSWYVINFSDKSRPSRGTFTRAVKLLDRIRFDNPTGKLADDATLAAGNAHFNQGNYEKADDFYEDLRKTFPTSEHQFLAHYFGVRTKLESYRGASYDGDPLGEAAKLITQIRKQFPSQAESDQYRDELGKADKLVRFLKAEREMKLARYYDGRAEYGGARFYYNILAREYPDTPQGKQAGVRLAEIRERPDTPSQPMSWLVNLFPQAGDTKPLIATGDSGGTLR